MPIVNIDNIGDDDTLDVGLPRLISNEPNNILGDVGLCSLYELYGQGPLEEERKKAKKNGKQKVKEEPKTISKKMARIEVENHNLPWKVKIEVDNDTIVIESMVRRTHQLNPVNYKVQLGKEPADE
ncbi:hypothetical protein R1flu_018679 [Riccia fluitans]|uniref:Uncharacterized protein n=1 Tax=Riccia fluitans TaxID=41844 RepID=A0ABD1ZGJ0_9MARC